jgi:hypothetical protein
VNGSGTIAEFDSPSGICVDLRDGSIIVSDYNNGVIKYPTCLVTITSNYYYY